MPESVRCLLCKHEGLNSIPNTHVKKTGMTSCACDPSAGEVKTGCASQPVKANQ